MKQKKIQDYKIGHKHEIKLRNIVVIFFSILIGLGSIAVFAQVGNLTISTSLTNAVQNIQRIIISRDGGDAITGNRLYDINYSSGKIKAYKENLSVDMFKNKDRATASNRLVLGIDTGTNDIIFLDKDVFSGVLGGGESGTVGPQGLIGPIGPTGETGVGISSIYVNSSGFLIFTLTNNTIITGGFVIGPQGPAGITGAQGITGTNGLIVSGGNIYYQSGYTRINVNQTIINSMTGITINNITGLVQNIINNMTGLTINNISGLVQNIVNNMTGLTINNISGLVQNIVNNMTGLTINNITGLNNADNLGNHTATGNLRMNGHRISNDGLNKGILIDNYGGVGINIIPNGIAFGLRVGGNVRMTGIMYSEGTNISNIMTTKRGIFTSMIGNTNDTKCVYVDSNGEIHRSALNCNGSTTSIGDNLGNHTATGNIKMGTHLISSDGSLNSGIGFDADNNLITNQKIKTYKTIQIANAGQIDCSSTNAGEIRFINSCFQGCDGTSWKDITGVGCSITGTTYQCLGNPPANSIPTSVGIIPQNTNRTYNSTPGACTYNCSQYYARDGTSCQVASQDVACGGAPQNTIWNTTNRITQIWNGTEWVPSNLGEYNITPSITECRFKCADGYVLNINNGTCVENECQGTIPANTIPTSTGTIPANTNRTYNSTPGVCTYDCAQGFYRNGNTNNCESTTKTTQCEGLPSNASWNITDQIIQTRNGIGRTPNVQSIYDLVPSTTECRFKCNIGYDRDGSSCKTITQAIACQGLPQNAVRNTASQINQIRNGTTRTPSNVGTYNINGSTTECKFKCQTNYVRDPSSNICQATTVDMACQGLPSNASWNIVAQIASTRNGSTRLPSNTGTYNLTQSDVECRFKCNIGYIRNGSSCTASSQNSSCIGLPLHASRNTATQINQNRNGSTRTPSNIGTYNITPSTTECKFKCDAGYSWDYNTYSCGAPSPQTISCQGLPNGGIWNTTSQISSTRNGTTRTPSQRGSYNLNPSTTECRFKCDTNYTRSGLINSCVPNTQTGQCIGLPINAHRNTASQITQTRYGSIWLPSTTGIQFQGRPSTTECRFECSTGYVGIGCNTPTFRSALCGPKPTNAYFSAPSCIFYGSSGSVCVVTQTWTGTPFTGYFSPLTGSYYNTIPLVNSCRFNCEAGYVRNGNSCISEIRIANCTPKPTNTMWNGIPSYNGTNAQIYQIRTGGSGGYYTPSNISFYSATATSRQNGCPFKCSLGYAWINNSCIANR